MSEHLDITPEGSVVPIYLVALTEEEIVERESVTSELEALQQSQIDAKQSALAKLAKLGLTEDEAKAVIGL